MSWRRIFWGRDQRVLGSCGEGQAFSETVRKTYNTIRPRLNKVSDFLIELEVDGPSVVVTASG